MTKTITAVLLCQGAATRMQPLSLTCPKALIPFCGRPLLEYTLDLLRESQIEKVIIIAGPNSIGFDKYETSGHDKGLYVKVLRDIPNFGSGGTLKYLVKHSKVDSDLMLVIYGDSLLQLEFAALLAAHERKDTIGCRVTIVWHTPDDLVPLQGSRTNYGILWLSKDDRCVRFVEKPPVTDISSSCASAGVYVIDSNELRRFNSESNFDLSYEFLSRLAAGAQSSVFGYHLKPGYRYDIGTIRDFVNRQFAALDGLIRVKDVVYGERLLISSSVKLGTQTKLNSHVILGNNVVVGDMSELTDCIVLDGSIIGNGVKMSGVVLGRDCKVQDNVRLGPGTVLGDHSIVSVDSTLK